MFIFSSKNNKNIEKHEAVPQDFFPPGFSLAAFIHLPMAQAFSLAIVLVVYDLSLEN